jgi:CheY-like chemotaxis protein
MADVAQLQQVIMNLIINASEAIAPLTGTITLTTGVSECDAVCLKNSRVQELPAPGRFVWLEVRDSGCGMDEGTLQKMFDPFFTTKFAGRGLGMSVVLGIIRAHGGALMAESLPGKGTTIRVLLPALTRASGLAEGSGQASARSESSEALNATLSGNVLLADDEEMVREVCGVMLEDMGLRVFPAVDGEDALRIFRDHGDAMDLVILDAHMPRRGGVDTFRVMRTMRSSIKVVISSGFPEGGIDDQLVAEGLAGVLQKPFTHAVLRRMVSDILAR